MTKFSLRQRIALSVVFLHLIYAIFGFYIDNKIFMGDYCTKQWFSGQVENPPSLLMISDFYIVPLILSAEFGFKERHFSKIDGTGGACTFVSVNPALPYSLIFILISSMVWYILGLLIGKVIENKFKHKAINDIQ